MTSTVNQRYAALVNEGEIERDPAQEALAARLTRLEERLAQHRLSRKSSQLGWLFGKNERQEGPIKVFTSTGEVGRGKTMLMDLFFRRERRATQAARALSRIHGRHPRAAERRAPQDGSPVRSRTTIRSSWSPPTSRTSMAALFRRIPRHRHCRRDDPRAGCSRDCSTMA